VIIYTLEEGLGPALLPGGRPRNSGTTIDGPPQ